MSDKLGKYTVSETDQGDLLVKDESINNKVIEAPDTPSLMINGAWYIEQLPQHIIMERTDGTLGMFRMTPFRVLTPKDITDYKGYHPRKCKGQPLPEYLYRHYGLSRNEEGLTEVIRVRLSPTEKEKLDTVAKNNDKNVSEFIREYVRGL
jgi:hypothetical protein